MDDKKIIDLINDAIIRTKNEMFVIVDALNNKIEAQDIIIKELKNDLKVTKDQVDDLDNSISEITDRFNL
jgi:peptidoglycan hydrolase CwlO-like protein